MGPNEPDLELAWEELSFWRDFVVWWQAERSGVCEPRILALLDSAERRYARALRQRQLSDRSLML